MSKYTVKLVGVDSEGNDLTMKWGTDLTAIQAAESVMQILSHKEDAEPMIGTDLRVFNGEIVVTETVEAPVQPVIYLEV